MRTEEIESLTHSCSLCQLASMPPRKILLSVLGQLLNGMMEDLNFPFYAHGRPRFPSPLVSNEGLCGRCFLTLFSARLIPSPLPSHDGGFHAVLDAEGEKILVGDGLGSEYSQDSSRVLGMQS